MSDVRQILERGVAGVGPPEDPLDRMLRRRARRRRNGMIGVTVLALLIAAVTTGGLVRAFFPQEKMVPARPTVPTPIPEGPTSVTIVVRDLEWDLGGIETLPPGPVRFVFVNESDREHRALLYRLEEGVTFERFRDALLSNPEEEFLPRGAANLIAVGEGPIAKIFPGMVNEARTVELEPGTYVLLDGSLDRDPGTGESTGERYYELGMLTHFQVRP
jgi:hypothetical protein